MTLPLLIALLVLVPALTAQLSWDDAKKQQFMKIRSQRRVLFALTLLCPAIVNIQLDTAATFTIADGDVAALITAINTGNLNGEDDTIELAANGNYTLTAVNNTVNGLPIIGSDTSHKLVIEGNGATLQRST